MGSSIADYCWLIAMSIFSPARRCQRWSCLCQWISLPRAMAILTIVANLLYSLEPVIIDLIDYLRRADYIMIGGIAVFVPAWR